MNELIQFDNYPEASKILKKLIQNGISIDDIANNYNLEIDFLIFLLTFHDKVHEKYILDAIFKHYQNYKINDNKVLVISDTHVGGICEDLYLLYIAYNYAISNNIKNIIHVGDMVEGFSCPLNFPKSINEQLEPLKVLYSKLKDINTTYYLFGNHDYNLLLFNNVDIRKHLKDFSNLKYIGLERSYIHLIDNDPIKLNHFIPMRKENFKLNIETNLTLEGHHHLYQIHDDNILLLPPLCKINHKINDSGFMELETTGKEYIMKLIGFNELYNPIQVTEKVIKKQNN